MNFIFSLKHLLIACALFGVLKLNNATELQCNFFDLKGLYVCWVQNLSIKTPYTITRITGHHLKGRNNTDLRQITIINPQITYFLPYHISEFFPNLEMMIVSGLSLRYIIKDCFKGLKQMKHLSLTNNEISSLPRDTFASLKNLKELHMDFNQVDVLDNDLFKYNDKLKTISFNGNRIKLIGLKTFAHLKKLKEVGLARNICVSKHFKNVSESYEETIGLNSIASLATLNQFIVKNCSLIVIKNDTNSTSTSMPEPSLETTTQSVSQISTEKIENTEIIERRLKKNLLETHEILDDLFTEIWMMKDKIVNLENDILTANETIRKITQEKTDLLLANKIQSDKILELQEKNDL